MARRSRAVRWTAFALAVSALLAGAPPAAAAADEPITPIPAAENSAPAKVALGRKLFDDVRVSHGNVFSCASCHALDRSGADGRSRPVGAAGRPLDFNAPTVFNAALNFRLNWRGNFRRLEDQNEAALRDRRLMNTSWEELLAKLRADREYRSAFTALYGSGPERASVLDALATFQRSLLTPDAPFDKYLRGRRDAITADQERGYRLFKSYGCIACHQGRNVGGNLFQKFGIFSDPLAGRAKGEADLGRFTVTHREEDRQVFRVPSLRNVAVTGPYFHNGGTGSLREAVDIMARSQLGRDLPRQDRDLIVEFLGTLTGKYQGRSLTAAGDRTTP